jgi:hypothetical protein
MSADVETIFAELCEQHGGDELSTAHKAVIRRIAGLLASDDLDRSDAATVASLQALLPPAPSKAAEASGWPLLDELSEDDWGDLVSLACRAGAFRCVEGGSVSIAPLSAEALLARANETIEGLKRDLADTKSAMSELAGQLVALRGDGAGALGSSGVLGHPPSADIAPEAVLRAPPGGDKGINSVDTPLGAPDGNVVRLRTPQEADDCKPLDRVSDYSFLSIGTGASRFDNPGPGAA